MNDAAEYLPDPKHNQPPPDLKIGEELKQQLDTDHEALVIRARDLLAMADRFDADHPTVENDEQSGQLAGVIAQMTAHVKVGNTTHGGVKEPYLSGGRIIDNFFFRGIRDPLENRAKELNRKQTAYLRAKADRERREAEEKAAAARAEQERQRKAAEDAERERLRLLADANKATVDPAADLARMQEAEDREIQAAAARDAEARAALERQQHSKVATSSNADLSRTRGDFAMTSLATRWKFEVENISKVPTAYLMVNESLVNKVISGKNGIRDIPGLRIYSETEARNR